MKKKKELEKISLDKIKDVLSRYEMRSIMAGSGSGTWVSVCLGGVTGWYLCNNTSGNCTLWHTTPGCYA